jgi:hypothetical protein
MKGQEGDRAFEEFIERVAADGFFRKAINNQCKHFEVKSKELLRNAPKNIRQQREYLLGKLKERPKDEREEWSEP